MNVSQSWRRVAVLGLSLVWGVVIVAAGVLRIPAADEPAIDFERARQLIRKAQQGEQLTAEERAYVERARAARAEQARQAPGADRRAILEPRESVGLTPLVDMAADAVYEGQDGGLYGGGRNQPNDELRKAAEAALGRIRLLDSAGQPAENGHVVLVSLSMSNATQEFSRFKQIADSDPEKSPRLTIVDCAQGGQAMAEWATPDARPWAEAERRIRAAGVTPEQVQVAWIKLANKGPRGTLVEHGKKLENDTAAVVRIARQKFPNLQVAYLGSRIYGGYTRGPLNPEPYAYESAYAARWLILRQQGGDESLNYDAAQGDVRAPLLLWGAYLWADGLAGRQTDDLVWQRDDFVADGTHPSNSGRDKVARMLLSHFKTDPLARPWFVGK